MAAGLPINVLAVSQLLVVLGAAGLIVLGCAGDRPAAVRVSRSSREIATALMRSPGGATRLGVPSGVGRSW